MHKSSTALAVLGMLVIICFSSFNLRQALAQESEGNIANQLALLAISPPPGNAGVLNLYRIPDKTGGSPLSVEAPGYPISAAWSPDGNYLAFIMITGQSGSDAPPSDFDIYRIDRQGANLAKLTDTPDCPEIGLAWSSDSQTLFFGGFCRDSQATSFWRLTQDSGVPEKLGEVQWDGTWAVWSPDLSKIALLAPRKAEDGSVYDEVNLTTPDGQGMINLADDAHAGYQLQQTTVLAWSPQNEWIAYASKVKKTDQGEVNQIILVRPDASEQKVLHTSEPGQECLNPLWSPDGLHLAFTCENNLFIIQSDGTNLKDLTDPSAGQVIEYPTWIPGGESLAFISMDSDGKRRLESVRIDGSQRQDIAELSVIQTFGLLWNPTALPVSQVISSTSIPTEMSQAINLSTATPVVVEGVNSTPVGLEVDKTANLTNKTLEAGQPDNSTLSSQSTPPNNSSSIWLLVLLLVIGGSGVFVLLSRTGKLPGLVKREEERKIRRECREREHASRALKEEVQPDRPIAVDGSLTSLAKQQNHQEKYEQIPEHAELLQQGIQQIRSKDIQGGIITLRHYLEGAPDDPTAWLWLGWACGLIKEYRSAERCFLRAERLGSPQAGEALEWLSKQR